MPPLKPDAATSCARGGAPSAISAQSASTTPNGQATTTTTPAALGQTPTAADNPDMSPGPAISPAYQQIINWYQDFQKVQDSNPVPLLITHGAPDEEIDQPKETDSSTPTIDIIA